MLKNTYNKCSNKNIWKKGCLKKYFKKKTFFSTKYTKNIIKNEIPSIYLKNWASIKWPFVVDMP